MGRHQKTENCAEDCFGCKIQTISIAPSALPTRSNAGTVGSETAVMHKDVDAYKRLRKDGLQPKSVKGAAKIEARAESRWEVETGMSLDGNAKIGRRYDEAQKAVNAGETF